MGMDDPDGFPAAAVRIAGWIILLQGQASLIGFLREPFVPPVDTNTQGIAADFLPSAFWVFFCVLLSGSLCALLACLFLLSFRTAAGFGAAHLPLISSFRITERVFSRMIFRT